MTEYFARRPGHVKSQYARQSPFFRAWSFSAQRNSGALGMRGLAEATSWPNPTPASTQTRSVAQICSSNASRKPVDSGDTVLPCKQLLLAALHSPCLMEPGF
jgi:hypothetical protein